MDSKTLNRIRTALDQGIKHDRELREKRDQKLWKNVSEPYRLESLLHSLSKIELDQIRKSLELKGISNLKKADLIQGGKNERNEKLNSVFTTVLSFDC